MQVTTMDSYSHKDPEALTPEQKQSVYRCVLQTRRRRVHAMLRQLLAAQHGVEGHAGTA